jgi:hypothetical protein
MGTWRGDLVDDEWSFVLLEFYNFNRDIVLKICGIQNPNHAFGFGLLLKCFRFFGWSSREKIIFWIE